MIYGNRLTTVLDSWRTGSNILVNQWCTSFERGISCHELWPNPQSNFAQDAIVWGFIEHLHS